ncbi:hypothetical protein JAO10_07835 [Burkholderia contaminans]|jgi:hypothetical protein|uniref:Uncharacterized protein n=2 Tax=Ralstonia TaxID=48736 RepID=A0AAD2END6_9RALS|nr:MULTISPECIES: hypothetical protein [Burkholderiaceae]MBH9720239.1 hypothetical protein [Burkholderia contaminans]MBR8013447.1 hypothetical protein [Burkholderia vietnamiensis]MCW3688908.1 hypothetical protein [Burkholderia cenocepacia]CAJ0694600.1 hypothetical protein R77591_04278 [Ralstonia mannitolilytica]HDR9039773.1 hypothetical protein [Burkholderia vietnamiensis]
MLVLGKTKSSQLCKEFFSNQATQNKGLNIIFNNYLLLNQFLSESHSEELSSLARKEFDDFKKSMKNMDLKLLHLSFGYSEQHQKFTFSYIIRSKKHNNPDFRVDGLIPAQIPFVFFPSMFASFLLDILKEVPYDQLIEVSKGN